MKREGLIYHYEWGKLSGVVVVAISRSAKIAYHTIRAAASGLVAAGIAGLIFTFGPIVSSEVDYRLNVASGDVKQEVQEAQIAVQAVEDESEKTRKYATELGLSNTFFSIYIPKIGAKSQIIENVDPVSEKAYLAALKKGVAHAAGSVFPGMDGATYLFAHSSEAGLAGAQLNTAFYLLRELKVADGSQAGDDIYVFFLDKLYKYKVVAKHTVGANDTHWLTEAREGNERLILQTCWPPGSSWKRLVIVAEPISD